ncbi:helix-turn-helix domain-containing protein [Ponticaulis profundi]|uniref:Helix-turn-helix domain-containing protein n=1 Tax=Ponticaulis profundi TaxID=2665222 RepID=A0ABW1S6B6_9PROT
MNDNDEINTLRRFGAQVRSIRLLRGISQEELAHRCMLDRSYVGGVERGERNLGLLNILAICTALEIKPSELFEGWRDVE